MTAILQKNVGKLNSERVKSIKKKLFSACGSKCYLCDKLLNMENSTIDHLIPKSLGGTNYLGNLAIACYDCNHDKKSDLDSEHLIYLCNRLQCVPRHVEHFFEVLFESKIINDKPYDFTKLSNKLITFYRTIKVSDIQLIENQVNLCLLSDKLRARGSGQARPRKKSISSQMKNDFLEMMQADDPDFQLNCFICSENKDVHIVRIISALYGGADHKHNIAPTCSSCIFENQNSFEKIKINHIIRRDFKDYVEYYPQTANEMYKYLEAVGILDEKADDVQKANLHEALVEMFSHNFPIGNI